MKPLGSKNRNNKPLSGGSRWPFNTGMWGGKKGCGGKRQEKEGKKKSEFASGDTRSPKEKGKGKKILKVAGKNQGVQRGKDNQTRQQKDRKSQNKGVGCDQCWGKKGGFKGKIINRKHIKLKVYL